MTVQIDNLKGAGEDATHLPEENTWKEITSVRSQGNAQSKMLSIMVENIMDRATYFLQKRGKQNKEKALRSAKTAYIFISSLMVETQHGIVYFLRVEYNIVVILPCFNLSHFFLTSIKLCLLHDKDSEADPFLKYC